MEYLCFVWIVCGFLGAIIGGSKNAAGTGFLLGLFFGPLGAIAAFAVDYRGKCPQCLGRVNKGASRCQNCGGELAMPAWPAPARTVSRALRDWTPPPLPPEQEPPAEPRFMLRHEPVKSMPIIQSTEPPALKGPSVIDRLAQIPLALDRSLYRLAGESPPLYRLWQVVCYLLIPAAAVAIVILAGE